MPKIPCSTRSALLLFWMIVILYTRSLAQMGTATPLPPAERQKAEAESKASGTLANYPKLVDITASTGIKFRTSFQSRGRNSLSNP